MQLVLKAAIAKDPRFKTEERSAGEHRCQDHAFLGHRLYPNKDGTFSTHGDINDFYETSTPTELTDYVCGARMDEEFNCLNIRRQGHYKLEDGKAEGYLQRDYLKADDYGPADKEEDFPLDGDPEIVRVARLQYRLTIRAATPQAAVRLYRAVRSGTARPAEDWDAPMADAK